MPQVSSSTANPESEESVAKFMRIAEAKAAQARASVSSPSTTQIMAGGGREPHRLVIPPARPQPIPEEMQRRQERERTAQAAQFLDRCQRLWECSAVPPRFLDADFNLLGTAPPAQLRVTRRLRELLDQAGMLALVGTRGTGKTWMSAAVIREFCRHGKRAKYVRTMEVFRLVRGTFSTKTESERDVIGELVRPDLLVLDEIQVRSESEFENNTLVDLIDQRYAALKSTVLIANLKPAALLQNVGASIESRLQEDGGILVCNWESYRANGKSVAASPAVDRNPGTYFFPPVSPSATPTDPTRIRTYGKL